MFNSRPASFVQDSAAVSVQEKYLPVSDQDKLRPDMTITISDSFEAKSEASKSEFTGNLVGALNYMQYAIEHPNPARPVNLQVNARIAFHHKEMQMDFFREDITYTFNDLTVAKRFFQALLLMQNRRMMGAYDSPTSIPLSEAMKEFGLDYKNGQPLPVPEPKPQANNNPADAQPKASASVKKNPVKLPVAAPDTVQPSTPGKTFSLKDFISRHKMDIFLTIITGGLYLIYLAVKEIVKKIRNASNHSNANPSSSPMSFSTATLGKKGLRANPNAPVVSSSNVPVNTAAQESSAQPLASRIQESEFAAPKFRR